jgi:O-acetyl-ADP-ribose deacetylase (regulator of RNase III)
MLWMDFFDITQVVEVSVMVHAHHFRIMKNGGLAAILYIVKPYFVL